MDESEPVCSFCSKKASEVTCIIKGPSELLYICDECVAICAEIVVDYARSDKVVVSHYWGA